LYESRCVCAMQLHSRRQGQAASVCRAVDLRRKRGTVPVRESSEEDGEAHDRWLGESCEHNGFLVGESLGSITLAKHLRDFLRGLQGDPAPRFPILLKKVVYDGTHTGDWIGSKEAVRLLQEVDIVLHSSDILSQAEKAFFTSMKRLCEASIAAGNPIVS